jgi:hypothetical protein
MPFLDFARKFRAFGVSVNPGTKHIHMEKHIGGKRVRYTIAVKHGNVDPIYVSNRLPKKAVLEDVSLICG